MIRTHGALPQHRAALHRDNKTERKRHEDTRLRRRHAGRLAPCGEDAGAGNGVLGDGDPVAGSRYPSTDAGGARAAERRHAGVHGRSQADLAQECEQLLLALIEALQQERRTLRTAPLTKLDITENKEGNT